MNWFFKISQTDVGKTCPICHGGGKASPSQPCFKCKGTGRIGEVESPILSPEQSREKLKEQIRNKREKMKNDYEE